MHLQLRRKRQDSKHPPYLHSHSSYRSITFQLYKWLREQWGYHSMKTIFLDDYRLYGQRRNSNMKQHYQHGSLRRAAVWAAQLSSLPPTARYQLTMPRVLPGHTENKAIEAPGRHAALSWCQRLENVRILMFPQQRIKGESQRTGKKQNNNTTQQWQQVSSGLKINFIS